MRSAKDVLFYFVSEWWEAFKMFDKNKDQHIDATELGTVLRGLGQNPTEKDISDMITEADLDGRLLTI